MEHIFDGAAAWDGMTTLLEGIAGAPRSLVSLRTEAHGLQGTGLLSSAYSKTDGVVAWQTCCDDQCARRINEINVDSSHFEMDRHRDVLSAVSDRLASRPDPAVVMSVPVDETGAPAPFRTTQMTMEISDAQDRFQPTPPPR